MKHKGFFIFKAAQIINLFCIGMLSMLFSWIMIHDYNLESQLGWFMALKSIISIIALIIIGLLGSYLAPKATLVTMSVIRTILILGLAIFWNSQPLAIGMVILGVVFVGSIGGSFSATISAGLYDKENFHNAIRINTFINSTIGIFSGALTGFLISQFSYNNLIIGAALGVCISLILIMNIKPNISQKKTVKPHYLVGIRAVIHNRFELWFSIFAALSNLVLASALMYLVPILIIKVYGYNAVTLGSAEGVQAVSALIASSLLNKYLNKHIGVYRTSILGLALVALGFALIVLGNNIVALFIAMFLTGLGLTTSLINISNIHIIATPDDVRPSAGAVNAVLSMSLMPFGLWFITKMHALGYTHIVLTLFSIVYCCLALSLLFLKDFKKLAGFTNQELENKYVEMYPKAYVSYG